jgi:hypothetical protein
MTIKIVKEFEKYMDEKILSLEKDSRELSYTEKELFKYGCKKGAEYMFELIKKENKIIK